MDRIYFYKTPLKKDAVEPAQAVNEMSEAQQMFESELLKRKEKSVGITYLNIKMKKIDTVVCSYRTYQKNRAELFANAILTNCVGVIIASNFDTSYNNEVAKGITADWNAALEPLGKKLFDHLQIWQSDGYIDCYSQRLNKDIEKIETKLENVYADDYINMSSRYIKQNIELQKTNDFLSVRDIKDKKEVLRAVAKKMSTFEREYAFALAVDSEDKPLALVEISSGSITGTMVDVCEVLKTPLLTNATGVYLFHNHPSGDCRPSDDDRRLTYGHKQALNLFNITLKDHIIVGAYNAKAYSILREDYINTASKYQIPADKKRLFVDMDGTLAVFTPTKKIETLYEPGYFLNLKPQANVVNAIKEIIKEYPDIEVNILSAYLSDSPTALEEKNAWIDKYLPEIDNAHRIFTPCGTDKKLVVPDGVRGNDFLLDDYTKNLLDWQPPGKGIKLLNEINDTRETWKSNKISHERNYQSLADCIISAMSGAKIRDTKNYFDTSVAEKMDENISILRR